MKLIKTINSILALFSIIAIFVTSTYIYQVTIQKKDYGNICGFTLFKIVTDSMKPTINIGDRVIVKLTKEIKENDIVIYINNGSYICHRVNKITDKSVICKGDNNNVEDEEISNNKIIGKVVYII